MSDALVGRGVRVFPAVLCALLALAVSTPGLGAQSATATVRVQENFRAAPNGPVVGVLDPGARLRVLGRRDRWLEVEAEGWVWMRSLQVTDREGMDLVVSEEGGENLRAEPSGRVVGRLDGGTLLTERERIPGWVRVRRRGWLWAPSADVAEPAGPARPASAPASGPAPAEAPPAAASGTATGRVHRAAASGAAILASPDGDTLAVAHGGAELPVLAREGSWARVRVDGWVWMPAPQADEAAPAAAPAADATPAQVAEGGDAFAGRLVSWELQFVSRERAEKVRTDFYEGEPFLLTRHPEGPFVYVAVPPDRLSEVEGLIPLERITVVGRVRVASSDLTGSPILDLVELRRAPRR